MSLEAGFAEAARGGGGAARIVSDALTGDVGEAADRIVEAAKGQGGPKALLFGGETTVRLTGAGGQGGRNQELALRVAMRAEELGAGWLFLSGGTDGRDGPTPPAAGGFADAGTCARIRAAGLDPAALLSDNNSHRALSAAGDLLETGATGTNVADIQVFLRG